MMRNDHGAGLENGTGGMIFFPSKAIGVLYMAFRWSEAG